MRKILIAVCDADGSYGERLGEWISLQKGEQIQAVFFSSPERFLEYHSNRKQDIVLLGKGFINNPQICEEVMRQDKAAEKGNILWMYLRDTDGKGQIAEHIRELPAIDRYQPASQILRKIFSVYQEWGDVVPGGAGGEKEIIGIYSPDHSIWQAPFTLTFAQGLAQKERVLYINFQECAGFRFWFREEYDKDLLDVMYLCLNSGGNIAHCISSALYTTEGVDYIPPAKDGGCLGEISAQDYQKFVRLLAENSGYDVLLLDFGMMIPGFFRLLGACRRVYIVTEPGEMQKAPLQQFQQMVKRQEDTEWEQKLMYLSLPTANAGDCLGEGKMQQWLWGAMGDFSRRLAGV